MVDRAESAGHRLKTFSQQKIDRIVGAMAAIARENAGRLAAMAVEETGRGNIPDKTSKNLFASVNVYNHIKDLKTCDVIRQDKEKRVIEIGVPFGVIAVIVPTTNPTSTTIFKVLSAVKGRNTVVISPHPQAVRCTIETARLMNDAALQAGAPEHCINCMDVVTLEGTNELMRHRKTRLILATGGMSLVRSAYSSGKPAYGVGPGNVPAFIERTAEIPRAVRDVLTGKTFDNGLLCSSEQAIVCDRPVRDRVLSELQENRAYLLNDQEQALVEHLIQLPDGRLNPEIVGKSVSCLAQKAGISVPGDVVCLVGFPRGVGREHPLSMEKLSPILAFYEVDGWQEGCRKCIELLSFGGLGHTMSIHSRDQRVILQFGLEKPAHRICVNTPATQGSVGLTTGLPPSMTLGCGGPGGNITSDNITALHLINVRRLAFGFPVVEGGTPDVSAEPGGGEPASEQEEGEGESSDPVESIVDPRRLRNVVKSVIGEYLNGKEARGPLDDGTDESSGEPPAEAHPGVSKDKVPVDFVCEEDVKLALRQNRKIVVGPRSILTPSARDLGEQHRVFEWR